MNCWFCLKKWIFRFALRPLDQFFLNKIRVYFIFNFLIHNCEMEELRRFYKNYKKYLSTSFQHFKSILNFKSYINAYVCVYVCILTFNQLLFYMCKKIKWRTSIKMRAEVKRISVSLFVSLMYLLDLSNVHGVFIACLCVALFLKKMWYKYIHSYNVETHNTLILKCYYCWNTYTQHRNYVYASVATTLPLR